MKVSLAPVPLHWTADRLRTFYREAGTWPVDWVYLGETVCSKRRELGHRDWMALAYQLREAGKKVVLSTLALIEARSELAYLRRVCANGEFLVEANDYAAVRALSGQGVPWVGGATLNIYSGTTLRLLASKGLVRWQPPADMTLESLASLRETWHDDWPETEWLGWGRQPLAWSARCFTARAHNRQKDDCGFVCIEHTDGITVRTRDGEPFLNINGVQTRADVVTDVRETIEPLYASGVGMLRIIPSAVGTDVAADALATAAATIPSYCAGGAQAPCPR